MQTNGKKREKVLSKYFKQEEHPFQVIQTTIYYTFFLFFLHRVFFEGTGKRVFLYVLSFISQHLWDQYRTYQHDITFAFKPYALEIYSNDRFRQARGILLINR